MKSESTKLGMSLSREMIRFIEAEEVSGILNIVSAVQVPLEQPFDFSMLGKENLVPRFSEKIDQSLENFSAGVKHVRLCIDRRLVLKKTFAADKNLTQDAIRKHIEWELDQALISPRDDYNVGFEHVVLQGTKNDIVVFAAIRKALVGYVENIFKKSRLTLEEIDLDLFASLRALVQAYPDKLAGVSALIECTETDIGYTILVDGQYAISTERAISTTDDKATRSDLTVSELAANVNAELTHLLEYLEEELGISTIDRIFIAGEAERSFASELEKLQLSASVGFAEPFNNVHRQLNIESQMLIDEQAEKFMSCFGMIL